MFQIGDRVRKNMGVRMEGSVIAPFFWKDCTDGQYREPIESDEPIVWVQWDNGTKGWIHESFLWPCFPDVQHELFVVVI